MGLVANMGVLNIYHPDIEEYLEAKSWDEGKLTHFNLSIMVDDDFMNAVQENRDIYLHYPVYDDKSKIIKDESKWEVKRRVNALSLWDKIMRKAYDTGEYGVLFYDNMNKDNNLWYTETVITTNPCGEFISGQVHFEDKSKEELSEYMGACNLGSVMVHKCVENPFTSDANLNIEKIQRAVSVGVRMLDNIVDASYYPLQSYKNYQQTFRTTGLGITGLADALAMLNVQYGNRSEMAVHSIMNIIAKTAYRTSIDLAKEKGSFPLFDSEKFVQSGFIQKHIEIDDEWIHIADDIKTYGIRNARILSVAPTGTMSLVWGENCSSGCEPIFALETKRTIKVGGQDEENKQQFVLRDYAYEQWLKINKSSDCVVKKPIFKTINDLGVDDHLAVLSAVAFHTDMSVSKTINVPTEYPFDDAKDIYVKCWRNGVKGCTIFRPNEIRQGIMEDNGNNNKMFERKDHLPLLPWGTVLDSSDNLIGRKRKIMTGCGSLHVQAWFDEIDGRCMEIFLSKGSDGGCVSFMIGLSRMISGALRTGMPFEYAIDQLKSAIACPSYVARTQSKHDTSRGKSCPDAIANVLIEMQKEVLSELDGDFEDLDGEVPHKNKISEKKQLDNVKYSICPECGQATAFPIGGCLTCSSCGWSKCG